MSNFLSGAVTVVGQTLHSSSADQYHKLGELVFSNDGRAYRYCQAGGTALVAGQLQQSQAEDTDTQNLTAVAAAVDDLTIASTTTVTVTANEYAEGFILTSVTPGVGRMYKIKGHIAYAAAAPTFNLDNDPVKVALTTTTRLDAFANPYKAVVVNPTTLTGIPVGVGIHPIVGTEFGWLQVGGVANILADGALLVGASAVASDGTAGAVEAAGLNVGTLSLIGSALTGITSTEYGAVRIRGLL